MDHDLKMPLHIRHKPVTINYSNKPRLLFEMDKHDLNSTAYSSEKNIPPAVVNVVIITHI